MIPRHIARLTVTVLIACWGLGFHNFTMVIIMWRRVLSSYPIIAEVLSWWTNWTHDQCAIQSSWQSLWIWYTECDVNTARHARIQSATNQAKVLKLETVEVKKRQIQILQQQAQFSQPCLPFKCSNIQVHESGQYIGWMPSEFVQTLSSTHTRIFATMGHIRFAPRWFNRLLAILHCWVQESFSLSVPNLKSRILREGGIPPLGSGATFNARCQNPIHCIKRFSSSIAHGG